MKRILEIVISVREDFGETNVLKTVQLLAKVGHVINILEIANNVREDSGELDVLKIVQIIVKFV